MRISPPGRVTPRLLAVIGVATAMIAVTAGPSTAATAGTPAAAATTAPPASSDVNHQKGDATEFAGYSGTTTTGVGATSGPVDDHGVSKPGSWTPKGSNDADNPDVAGQQAANKVPDKIVKVTLPTKPTKASVAAVREALQNNAKAQVTVLMNGTDLTVGASGVSAERADVQAAQADLARTLAGTGASKISTATLQPAATYRITDAGLDALLADPSVADVTLDGAASAELASSTGVIQSTQLNAAGVLGNNFDGSATGAYQVAVIDSGVDNQHNAFTGRIVSQACFVTDNSCLGGTNASTAAGSADECTHSTDCDHGTHVAGIAAGALFTGGHEGVARGAQVVAIKVAQDDPVLVHQQRAAASADPEELLQPEHRCGEPVHRHQRHVHPGSAGVV